MSTFLDQHALFNNLSQEWGMSEHHNAMVFSVEIEDDLDDPDQAKVH